jgi:hypothetical protein
MRTFALFLGLVLAILIGLTAQKARADSEARQGADWVRTSDKPCTDAAVLPLLQGAGYDLEQWQAARASFGGREFGACWHTVGNVAHLVYEDGDQGIVPLDALKPLRDA